MPVAPEVITIQGWLEVADHVQVGPLVKTFTEPAPPGELNDPVAGDSDVTLHPLAAAWVTECVWEPEVMVAVREIPVEFRATL